MSVLHESAQFAFSLGIDMNKTWNDRLRGRDRPITLDVYRKAKSTLQHAFMKQLLGSDSLNPNYEVRLRHKLERWRLDHPIGLATRRLLSRFERLKHLVTPRVQAAVFKTIWNGWCTKARFQNAGACVLSCSPDALDRIEHYAACPHQKKFLIDWFGLPDCFASLPYFLLVADGMTDRDITLLSVSVYAMFRATNCYRHKSSFSDSQV